MREDRIKYDLEKEYDAFRALRPVFVGGLWRSGTTLLQRLLDAHPDLLVYPLEDCLVRDFRLASLRGARAQWALKTRDAVALFRILRTSRKLDRVFSARRSVANANLRSLGLGSSGEENDGLDVAVFREAFSRALRSRRGPWRSRDLLLAWMFAYFWTTSGRIGDRPRAWVTKCPEAATCVDEYFRSFEDCRVIEVFRDARSVFVSIKGLPHGDRSTVLAAASWMREIGTLVVDYRSAHARSERARIRYGERFLVVRYEDLVRSTRGAMEKVASFIGVDFDPVLERPTQRGAPWGSNSTFDDRRRNVVGQVSDEHIDAWKTALSWPERILLERALRRELGALSYR